MGAEGAPNLIVELYAIRRKSDGFMLPAGRKRGFTHDNPVDPARMQPRLFTQRHHAAAALRWWLEGETTVLHYEDPRTGEHDETWKLTPRPDRKAEDMEVVVVRLVVMRPAPAPVICGGCKREIDPDTCGCGGAGCRPDFDGHSFIPAGCVCFYPKEEGEPT